jgi:protein TonB
MMVIPLFLIISFIHVNYVSQQEKIYTLLEVDTPPVLSSLLNEKGLNTKNVFEKSVVSFVQKNISIITGRKTSFEKVYVEILIDEQGNHTIINSRATNKKAEKEAIKTIKKLPYFIPAKVDNKPVKMKFTIPIRFDIIVLN